ncbi:MAG: RsmE family RNA methyltransferase [Planctomycetota bacterium]|nr:RsmE family RNA methyltransferase [Planctomycetota bacterium]
MTDAPWFHHAPLPRAGGRVWLNGDETRHVAGSRRLRAGDAVTFSDGDGWVASGFLTDSHDAEGRIGVDLNPPTLQARLGRSVVIATAIPKGDRSATLLESLGPLGIEGCIPLKCAHSVVTMTDHLRVRFERILLEGSKQSRSAYIPRLRPEQTPLACVQKVMENGSRAIILDSAGDPLERVIEIDDAPIVLFVGPEGGFSAEEISAMTQAGANLARLGAAVLRVELAAIVAAARARR